MLRRAAQTTHFSTLGVHVRPARRILSNALNFCEMDSVSSLPDPVPQWPARIDEGCGTNHAARSSASEPAMLLIVYYLIFMIAGDFAAYFIGLAVEYEWGSQASLIVFLALYFLFLWVSWVLAVWMTKPRGATQSAS